MDKLDAVKKVLATLPGPRPQFFQDPSMDQVIDMTVALAGEVAVLYERLDSLERLIEAAGIVKQSDLNTFQPDQHALAERMKWNEAYVLRVFHSASAKDFGEGQTE